MSVYQIFAEWRVRRIPEPPKSPQETYSERVKRWALSAIGVEGIAQDIFIQLEKIKMVTIDDLGKHFDAGLEEIQEHLDLLYTTGLVERIGKAYLVREDISTSIIRRLIPRVTETLRGIAKVESNSRSYADHYRRVRGRAFSDVREAVVAFKEMSRNGGSPIVRAVGVQGYSDDSVEVEDPVLECSYDDRHIVIVSDSGERIVVGDRKANGVDVKAHTIIVKG